MSTSVFLSNTTIQIVVGKTSGKRISIERIIEEPMPNDAILNGVIVPGGDEVIAEKLKDIRIRHRISENANLVINSPQFMADVIEAPALSVSKTTSYIDKQTKSDQYSRIASPVKGWYLIDKAKSNAGDKDAASKMNTRSLIAEVCDKEFLDRYVKLFANAGFKLGSVHDGVKLADKLLENCVGDATAIYMIRDGQQIVTILYVKGKYFYDSTKRTFRTPCTDEYAQEIINNISGIRQFAGAQRIGDPITDIYFAGMGNEEISMLKQYIEQNEASLLVHGTTAPSHIKFNKWNDKFTSFIYPIAGLQNIQKGYSILSALKKGDETYEKKAEFMKKAIPVIILSSVLAVISLFLLIVYLGTSHKLKEINEYNSQPSVIQASMEYDSTLVKSANAGKMQGGAELLNAYLDTYPLPNSKINDKILEAAKGESVVIEFNSYDSESGIFAITASSYEVENINKFIAKLMSMDIFEDVDYTGYEWSDSSETWSIKVICSLSENKGSEETK